MNPRTKPYTERGIRRLQCVRCGDRGFSQWNICSDNTPDGKPQFRVFCVECDIQLNELVMRFARVPGWYEKCDAYEKAKRAEAAR